MAICNVGSHHDLGGVVRGWHHPTHLWSSQHLGNSAQVLRGGGPLLVVHGAGVAPHHSIMAICNVGSHHDLGGVVRGLLTPHTCGHPRLRQFCTSLERWGPLLVVHGTRVAPHHSIMAICNVGSHHDLGGVVRGWLIHTLVVITALGQFCTSLERWGAT